MADRCGSLRYTVRRSSKRRNCNNCFSLHQVPGRAASVKRCATATGSPQRADRRSFVRAVGVLTGVIALGNPLAALLPSRAWAVELQVLSSAEAAALLALIRSIAPHDTLDVSAYALVVKAVDADAAASAEARAELKSGLPRLAEGVCAVPE